MSTLKVVADDTPKIVMDLESSLGPIDLSDPGTVVNFKVKNPAGSVTVVVCDKLVGLKQEDGTIITTPPYNVAGAGGRCVANCPNTVFPSNPDADETDYTAEIEIVTGGGDTTTVYKIVRIIARNDF